MLTTYLLFTRFAAILISLDEGGRGRVFIRDFGDMLIIMISHAANIYRHLALSRPSKYSIII